jgi:hypothetical protein
MSARRPPGRAGLFVASGKQPHGFMPVRRSSDVCNARGDSRSRSGESTMIGNSPGMAPSTTIGAEVVQFRPGFRCGRDDRDWPWNSHGRLSGLAANELTQSPNHYAQPRDDARKCIVKLQFSIRAYMLLVVYVASITTLCEIVPWAIRTYHP